MNIDAKLIFKLISSMFIFFLVFNYNNLKVDLNEYYSFFPNNLLQELDDYLYQE